jgi:hypothetical protein
MVGKVKRIAVACHGSTVAERSILRYKILVALRWQRELAYLRGFAPGLV